MEFAIFVIAVISVWVILIVQNRKAVLRFIEYNEAWEYVVIATITLAAFLVYLFTNAQTHWVL